MNSTFDHLLVALLVLAALVYAVCSLGPKLLRARLLETLGLACERGASALPGLGPLGRQLRGAAARRRPGCGSGCDSCGGSAPPAARGANEIRIPVEKVGRRN